jgi:cytochrome c oxidase assembly factor CtaG
VISLLDAVLASWPFRPWFAASLLFAAVVYVRGWRVYHRRDPERWPVGRPIAFIGGLAAIYLALASPIEPFAALMLSVHMVQHLLLMMAAPPLIWLGNPLLPLVRGLPEPVRTYWVAPLLQCVWLRRVFSTLTKPVVSISVFLIATWMWHTPVFYDLALESPWWHYIQHVSFLAGGLLFWFPVIRPYPFRPSWPLWLLLPYLLAADLSNTLLSALLTFSDRILYFHYAAIPPVSGVSALEDQSTAGVMMWVPGSLVYLPPLAAITVSLLFGDALQAASHFLLQTQRHPTRDSTCSGYLSSATF